MGKIVISENTSLDGVMQQDDFRLAGWFNRMTATDRAAWAEVEFEEAMGSTAMLLGRRTYEWFVAKGWPTRGGDWSDRLRSMPKYVVSSTLDRLDWANSTVLRGDVGTAVSALRQRLDGDVVVYGSGQLAHSLMRHDLVDELRLMLCPFVLGEGSRLYRPGPGLATLRLTGNRTVGDSVVQLTYRPVRDR